MSEAMSEPSNGMRDQFDELVFVQHRNRCGAVTAANLAGAMQAAVRWALDRIEDLAETNMMRTGKLEGMHYQALKRLRVELGIPFRGPGHQSPPLPPTVDPGEWWLDLPIVFREREAHGEWTRETERAGTVRELLEIWDLNNPGERSEMAQVLRHLRRLAADHPQPGPAWHDHPMENGWWWSEALQSWKLWTSAMPRNTGMASLAGPWWGPFIAPRREGSSAGSD